MKKIASVFMFLMLFASLYAQKPYKGAEVYSKGKVLYGKFEMNMKMIKGSGMLSTFYTIEQSSGSEDYNWEELDIEVLGKNNAEIMSTNIFTDAENGDLIQNVKEIHLDYSLADDFHTYTLEWTPNYVAWFIDGVELRREIGDVVNDLDLAQGFRFNAWISSSPGWVGHIDKEALPSYQYVDWFEYSRYNVSSGDFTLAWRDDFDGFNSARWSKAEWTFNGNEVDFIKENAFIQDGKLVLAITDPNAAVGIYEKRINPDFVAKFVPDSNEIVIRCLTEGEYKIELFDSSGKIQLTEQFNTSCFSIPCSNIKRGFYVIRLNNKGIRSEQKLVIE